MHQFDGQTDGQKLWLDLADIAPRGNETTNSCQMDSIIIMISGHIFHFWGRDNAGIEEENPM